MNLPYSVRLLCICLASFFLVNLVAGVAVSALANAAGRLARRMQSCDGARLLLVLRFIPPALAVCVVGGVCVPSYLWMEPAEIDEPVGWLCLLAAGLAILASLHSAVRAASAVIRSRRYLRHRPVSSQVICVDGQPFAVGVIGSREPLFALAGIVRPCLLISQSAVAAFPGEELAAALRHEQAHGRSQDNFKRLMMLLAPDTLPFLHALRPLERMWTRLAEWAADDEACAGSPRHSVSLAAALVRAARLAALPATPPDLVTALLANAQDLAVRVDRLLRNTAAPAHNRRRAACGSGILVIAVCAITVMLHPATLLFAHGMLERLVH